MRRRRLRSLVVFTRQGDKSESSYLGRASSLLSPKPESHHWSWTRMPLNRGENMGTQPQVRARNEWSVGSARKTAAPEAHGGGGC